MVSSALPLRNLPPRDTPCALRPAHGRVEPPPSPTGKVRAPEGLLSPRDQMGAEAELVVEELEVDKVVAAVAVVHVDETVEAMYKASRGN